MTDEHKSGLDELLDELLDAACAIYGSDSAALTGMRKAYELGRRHERASGEYALCTGTMFDLAAARCPYGAHRVRVREDAALGWTIECACGSQSWEGMPVDAMLQFIRRHQGVELNRRHESHRDRENASLRGKVKRQRRELRRLNAHIRYICATMDRHAHRDVMRCQQVKELLRDNAALQRAAEASKRPLPWEPQTSGKEIIPLTLEQAELYTISGPITWRMHIETATERELWEQVDAVKVKRAEEGGDVTPLGTIMASALQKECFALNAKIAKLEASKRTLPKDRMIASWAKKAWPLGTERELAASLKQFLGIEDAQGEESDDGAVLERGATVGSDHCADLAHEDVMKCPTCHGSGTVDEWVDDRVCQEHPCPECGDGEEK